MKSPEFDGTELSELPESTLDVPTLPDMSPPRGASNDDDDVALIAEHGDVGFGLEDAADETKTLQQADVPDLEKLTISGIRGATDRQPTAEGDQADTDDDREVAERPEPGKVPADASGKNDTDGTKAPTSGRITDEASFNEVYKANAGYIIRVLVRGGMTRDDAEDVAQTTFMKAWQNRDKFDGANATAWLTRIATNTSVDRARVEQRHPQQTVSEEQQDAALRNASNRELLTDDQAITNIEAGGVLQLLQDSGLSEDWQRILVLKHGYGLMDREVGEELDISRNTAATGAMRAMQKVRGFLDAQD